MATKLINAADAAVIIAGMNPRAKAEVRAKSYGLLADHGACDAKAKEAFAEKAAAPRAFGGARVNIPGNFVMPGEFGKIDDGTLSGKVLHTLRTAHGDKPFTYADAEKTLRAKYGEDKKRWKDVMPKCRDLIARRVIVDERLVD